MQLVGDKVHMLDPIKNKLIKDRKLLKSLVFLQKK